MMESFVESREEMEAILREIPFGFLGMAVGGEPYLVPLNYAYIDGKILFHCALEGKKLDYLASNPTVCFTAARQVGAVQRHNEGDLCHMDSESVVCYGTARIIEDLEERTVVLNAFNRYFRPDIEGLSAERVAGCAAVEIAVSEMTGRRERDRKLTCWRYRFQVCNLDF
jgi:nitroimidazol reductase NimA-like FMN-containing flavoprotein (pyridoxamine 5'-phosphate oxidase superfamily)